MKLIGKFKRRYRIIIFIALPLCFALGFFLSIEITQLLGYRIDPSGKIIILLSFVPLYGMSVRVAKREVLKHQRQDLETSEKRLD